MNPETREKIAQYIRNQLAQAGSRLHAYTVDSVGKPNYKRPVVKEVEEYLGSYQERKTEPRWVSVVGLRGVGKTTALAQLYTQLTNVEQSHKLFLSLDETVNVLKVNLYDVLTVYEEILGSVFENLTTPVYLFFDEVHHDDSWAAVLKGVYDRSPNVFMFITGSAALLLQSKKVDVSRRMVVERLYPLSFSEYMYLKQDKPFPESLTKALQEALFNSPDAKTVYQLLKTHEQEVSRYWLGIDRLALDTYLRFATLPFAFQFTKETLIYGQIRNSLDTIIKSDLPKLKKFDAETINKIESILYALVSADIVSLKKLSEMFSMSINTLIDVLDTLSTAEVLIRVYPYGTHYSQVRKPSKYLFMSPAYRSMFFHFFGSQTPYENYKGSLLEDIIGMYLHRMVDSEPEVALTYDNAAESADFIVSLIPKKIALEVGFGKKGIEQVENTMKRVDVAYGIVVSSSKLYLAEEKNIVSVPLEYFLLL